jgi:small subunit ribosomal protein S1
VRGFCPISHISNVRSEDLDQHLGQTYPFKVLEYKPDDQRLVVSRAAHLDEERERLRQEAWSTLEVGTETAGRVRSLTDFGAFIDLGGVDGLVHVTEIAHHRVKHPREELQAGEEVRVKVLDLDREHDRISLSMKALIEDPWAGVAERYPVRGPIEGTVVRKTDFGVFVQLEPGVDGLLHVSQLPPGLEMDAPELEMGETVRGWVRDVDAENRRIGLTMRQMPDRDPWDRIEMRYQEGQTIEGTVENGTDFGVFVELEPGLSGLIPISELGLGRDVDPRSAFTPGEKLELKLMALDPNRRRISLSVRALKRDRERHEYLQHMDSASGSEPAITGFGAQLAAALERKTEEPAPSETAAAKTETEKKTATKKTTTTKKAASKKTATKKTAAKKTSPKKTAAKKKSAAEKTTGAKKTAAKKSATTKTTTEKTPASTTATKKAAPKKKATTKKKTSASKTTTAKKAEEKK